MDDETKLKYRNLIMELGYDLEQALKFVNDPDFTEELFESKPFQETLLSKKLWTDRKAQETSQTPQKTQPVKPQPVKTWVNPEDIKRASIERQQAVIVAFQYFKDIKTEDVLKEADKIYKWIHSS